VVGPVAVVAVVFQAVPLSASAAVRQAPSLPPTGAGVDISFPQCSAKSHLPLPTGDPFAVIGVNGGVASTSNPCFLAEYNSALLLAGTTEQPHASVYVNTGNPGLAAAWWPDSDNTQAGTAVANPDGTCTYVAGAACAYIYGYSMAQADFRRIHRLHTRLPHLWWLDVETTNTWQTDLAANTASLTGMVDYFESKDLQVGLYSTSYQWGEIAGTTDPNSHLAGLPSWLAGGSQLGAPGDCELGALTPNGRVAMIQYVTNLDNDFSCHLFRTETARISPSSNPTVGTVLTATAGVWGPGRVSYAYQWNRNGLAIPGATARTYLTTEADLDCTIWVTVTGSAPGYSTATKTSRGVSVLPARP
jgi:hypothetical protein